MTERFHEVLQLPAGPARTAALAEWFQGLCDQHEGPVPVLVGGSAVELYSGGAYTSGDLDFVGTLTPGAELELRREGFEKAGRHWVHEAGQVFIELPGDVLTEGEEVIRLDFNEHSVLTISPEDALVDRLAAWEHWKSSADGVAALLLYRKTRDGLDEDRLRRIAGVRGLVEAFEKLLDFDRRTRDRVPTPQETEAWATGIYR